MTQQGGSGPLICMRFPTTMVSARGPLPGCSLRCILRSQRASPALLFANKSQRCGHAAVDRQGNALESLLNPVSYKLLANSIVAASMRFLCPLRVSAEARRRNFYRFIPPTCHPCYFKLRSITKASARLQNKATL